MAMPASHLKVQPAVMATPRNPICQFVFPQPVADLCTNVVHDAPYFLQRKNALLHVLVTDRARCRASTTVLVTPGC